MFRPQLRFGLSFLCLLPIFPLFFSSYGPLDKLAERIMASTEKYMEEYTQEKVFLHFDKPYYTKGDDIWYKAYLTAGAFHQPSPLSKTLYVELLNADSGVVEQQVLRVEDGLANGDFSLPDSLPSGQYQVRAYTNWMRNFAPEFVFTQNFTFRDPEESGLEQGSIDLNKIDLQFFPEGGEWIAGVPSLLAFKAVNALGDGAPVQGRIVDRSGKTVAEFEDYHLGMGAISMYPTEPGNPYKAIVALPNGDSATYDLPAVKESGIAMSVQNTAEDFIRVVLQAKGDIAGPEVLIVGHVRGAVQFIGKGDLTNGAFSAKIPRKNFSEGIVHLSVFDATGRAVAERLAFNRAGKLLKVQVSADKATYGQREKVTLSLNVTDEAGQPMPANLSLAVNDLGQLTQKPYQENLYSYLLLSSDLKGKIEDPGYYFSSEEMEKTRALDFLMMTQGWRRFKWEALLEDEFPEIAHFIEQGIMVKGTVTRAYSDKPVVDGKVTLFVKDSTSSIYSGKTGNDGKFFFPKLQYEDLTPLVIQAENQKGKKNVDIYVDDPDPAMEVSATFSDPDPIVSEELAEYLAKAKERRELAKRYNMDDLIMLEGLEIEGRREVEKDKINRIYGKGDVIIRPDENPSNLGLIHPLQLIQGRVAGVRVIGSGIDYTVQIRGVGSINSGTTPLILLDNIPVDIQVLNSVSIRDIETIEVFKDVATAAIFGANGANGAIAIYTKSGNGLSKTGRDGVINFAGVGYTASRAFYSPNYGERKPEHNRPDRRPTLLWEPTVAVDSTGQASLEFYTSDVNTTLGVQVQGLSPLGHAGAGTATFKVE